jgi:CTP:molybdopterin cytidylyltransferase MocA
VRIAGVVLAAGSGSRMGMPKAELVLAGERLVDRAVRVLREGGCEPVIAVVRDGVVVPGATAVVNPAPERGMRSSLQLGLESIGGADAMAVLLVDMPGVGADAVRATLTAWRPGRIAVARFGHRRGHPIVMDRDTWRYALDLATPDAGARVLLRTRPSWVDDVVVPGSATDLDTPADLEAWNRPPPG